MGAVDSIRRIPPLLRSSVYGLNGWHRILVVARTAINQWSDHNTPRLGAALAFYSLLSLAPLVMVLVPVTSLMVGTPSAEAFLLRYAARLAGPVGANALQLLMNGALKHVGGTLPGIVAVVTLLFGASSMFAELRSDLNTIWNVQEDRSEDFIHSITKRYLIAILTVISLDVFLLVSVTVTVAAAGMGKFLSEFISFPSFLVEVSNFIVTCGFTSVVIALIFRYVPDRCMEWRFIWIGAMITAFLEALGKLVLGIYLGTAAIGSAYGAASSVFAIAVWMYYGAQIFLLGAEFTSTYAASCAKQTAAVAVSA